MNSLYEISVKTIKGQEIKLEEYKDKVLLIVNVASKCGLTPQYKGLEELYKKYKDKNLVVLGFPCNQFGSQEPGDEAAIQNFCQLAFNISFPMFAKIDVNGKNEHPLYTYLKGKAPGLLGSKIIKWNFTKFLVDKNGNIVQRFSPTDKPESLISKIEKYLD